MIFRLCIYGLLLTLTGYYLPELRFNAYKIASGSELLSNEQLILLISVITVTEVFINFTKFGKWLCITFYRMLTAVRVVSIVGLISFAAIARSSAIEGSSEQIIKACENEIISSICKSGGSLWELAQEQVLSFF